MDSLSISQTPRPAIPPPPRPRPPALPNQYGPEPTENGRVVVVRPSEEVVDYEEPSYTEPSYNNPRLPDTPAAAHTFDTALEGIYTAASYGSRAPIYVDPTDNMATDPPGDIYSLPQRGTSTFTATTPAMADQAAPHAQLYMEPIDYEMPEYTLPQERPIISQMLETIPSTSAYISNSDYGYEQPEYKNPEYESPMYTGWERSGRGSVENSSVAYDAEAEDRHTYEIPEYTMPNKPKEERF